MAKKPYMFVIFQGGGGGRDPLFPLWIRACAHHSSLKVKLTKDDKRLIKLLVTLNKNY